MPCCALILCCRRPYPQTSAQQTAMPLLTQHTAMPLLCPLLPPADDPTWKPVFEEMEFDCGHFGVFENAIDMAHIHYLHGDSFGNEVRLAGRAGTKAGSEIQGWRGLAGGLAGMAGSFI